MWRFRRNEGAGAAKLIAILSSNALALLLGLVQTTAVAASNNDEGVAAGKIIADYKASHKPPDKKLAEAIFELGESFYDKEKFDKAWEQFALCVETTRQARDASPSDVAWRLEVYALRKQSQDRLSDAEGLFKQAVTIVEKEPSGWQSKLLFFRYLKNYMLQYRYQEAAPAYRMAFRAWGANSASDAKLDITDTIFIADCANDIGKAFVAANRFEQAQPFLKQAVEVRTRLARLFGKREYVRESPWIDVADSLLASARCSMGLGKVDEAQSMLSQADRLIQENKLPAFDWERLDLYFAVKKLNALSADSTRDRPGKPALLPKGTAYGAIDEPAGSSLWAVKYPASLRLKREQCWCWSQMSDEDRLLLSASTDSSTFPASDPRRVLTNFSLAIMKAGDAKEALPYANEFLEPTAKQNPALASELVFKLIDAPSSDSDRVYLVRGMIDSASQYLIGYAMKRDIATRFMSELKKSGWSKSSVADEVAKRIGFLEKNLGDNNPELLALYPQIADELESDMKYYDAMMIYRRLVGLYKTSYGAKSSQVKEALTKYAELLRATNDREGADKANAEAAAI